MKKNKMTAKEFVKSKYPSTRAERYKRNWGGSYCLIWADFKCTKRLGEGNTTAQAWSDAKKNIS